MCRSLSIALFQESAPHVAVGLCVAHFALASDARHVVPAFVGSGECFGFAWAAYFVFARVGAAVVCFAYEAAAYAAAAYAVVAFSVAGSADASFAAASVVVGFAVAATVAVGFAVAGPVVVGFAASAVVGFAAAAAAYFEFAADGVAVEVAAAAAASGVAACFRDSLPQVLKIGIVPNPIESGYSSSTSALVNGAPGSAAAVYRMRRQLGSLPFATPESHLA